MGGFGVGGLCVGRGDDRGPVGSSGGAVSGGRRLVDQRAIGTAIRRVRRTASATHERSGGEPVIDFIALEGDAGRYPAAMQELASRKPDVLIAPGPEISVKAARAATQTIPIVMIGVD